MKLSLLLVALLSAVSVRSGSSTPPVEPRDDERIEIVVQDEQPRGQPLVDETPIDSYTLYDVRGWDGVTISDAIPDQAWDALWSQNFERELPTFSATHYSLLKFGHTDATTMYAQQLGQMFEANFPQYFSSKSIDGLPQVVITSSAYKNMPVAASHLTNAFYDYVNARRFASNLEAFEHTKIERQAAPSIDFSKITSKKEREAVMSQNVLGFDFEFLRGKHLVVLDDCIISGSHQKNIVESATGRGIGRMTFLYIAAVTTGEHNTKAEHYMNSHYVDDFESWLNVMSQPDAMETTARSMKHFLKLNYAPEDMIKMASQMPCKILYEMHHGAINDGLAGSKSYINGIEAVSQTFFKKCGGFLRTPGTATKIELF